MKKIIIFLISLLYFSNISATHIVGGVIEYKFISGTTYDIYVKIYKDCGPDALAFFDGEVGSAGQGGIAPFLISAIEEGFLDPITASNGIRFPSSINNIFTKTFLVSAIVNPCIMPDGTCIQEGVYGPMRITLPRADKKYTLVYQRCCRNDGILNINLIPGANPPTMPGMTITCEIPPSNIYRNNSATFSQAPPFFICKDIPFYYDHSATDIDGDQLRYSIRTPLQGLDDQTPVSSGGNQPNLVTIPPVVWKSPYNLANPLGGVPMRIDSVTGLLSCTPNQLGRFVVSVECKEYRNGVLINTFFRDYQFNVRPCDAPFSDMPLINRNPKAKIGYYKTNCKNYTITFENNSSNYDSVLWNFDDPPSGANNFSREITPIHTFTKEGRYIVKLIAYKNVIRNGSPVQCSDTLNAIVDVFPLFTTNFNFTSRCQGEPISFIDATTSTHGNLILWKWDFGGQGTSLNQNANFTFNSPGTYDVKLYVKDNKECEEEITKQVVVYPKPTIRYIVPDGCQGEQVEIKCNNTVPAPYNIFSNQWIFPQGNSTRKCDTTIILNQAGNFTLKLIATTNQNCKDSANIPLRIFSKPTIQSSSDTFICYDQSTLLRARGGVTYQWTPTNFLANPNLSATVASPPFPNAIRYTVKGTDNNGCSDTASTLVQFHAKPFIDAGLDTSVCLDPSPFKFRDSVQLSGKGVFTTTIWEPTAGLNNPNIANPLAKPRNNTNYIFTGIDANRCRIKDTVLVVVLDPSLNLIQMEDTFFCNYDTVIVNPLDQGEITKYEWRPKIWVSNPNVRNPKFFPLDTTAYILKVENYCYIKEDTVVLNAIPRPNAMLRNDSTCLDDIYQFKANPNLKSYFWYQVDTTFKGVNSPNPTASPKSDFLYKIRVEDFFGCVGEDSMWVRVNFPPSLFIKGLPNFICQGDSAAIEALSSSNTKITWSPNVNLSPNINASKVTLYPSDTFEYKVTSVNANKCSTTRKVIINVQKPIISGLVPFQKICIGDFINLKAKGGLYYLWSPNKFINDTIIDTPQVFPKETIRYFVKISNDCFTDTASTVVQVDTLPVVVISPKDTLVYRSAEVILSANSKTALKYDWTPKIGDNNPFFSEYIVAPSDTTLFYVTVEDINGCKNRDSSRILIYGKTVLLIPSGFSPNGDSKNDIFRISKHLNIKTLNSFEVYNRWGEKVFSTNKINEGWDGTHRGEPANTGVYVWKIEATTFENEKVYESGNVTLIR